MPDMTDARRLVILLEQVAEAARGRLEDVNRARVPFVILGLEMFVDVEDIILRYVPAEDPNRRHPRARMAPQQIEIIVDLPAPAPRPLRDGRGTGSVAREQATKGSPEAA
jgi:hypothetical protein